MDKGALVDNFIKDGEKIITLLKNNNFNIKYAFWAYLEDYNEWRLVIAMPRIKIEGKMKYYEKIQSIFLKNNFSSTIAFDSVMIVDESDKLIDSLKKIKNTQNKLSGFSLTGVAINGNPFPESFVYNLN